MSTTRIDKIGVEVTRIEKLASDLDEELGSKVTTDEKYLSEQANQLALRINALKAYEEELNASLEKTWYRSNLPTPENKKILEILRQIQNIKTLLKGHEDIISGRTKKAENQLNVALVDGEINERSRRRELLISSITGGAAAKGFSFTRASDAFSRAVKAPAIDLETALKLLRRSAAYDALKRQGSDGSIKGLLRAGKNELSAFAGEIEEIVTSIVSSTANAGVKSIFLVFGWPFILPMKLVSYVSNGISTGSRAAQAFMQSLDNDLEKIIDSTKPFGYPLYFFPGIIIKPLKWASFAIKEGTEFLGKVFDTDRWFENSPMTQGFVVGGLGTGIIIAIAIASVFTFGIPIAAVGVGAALAALGGLIAGGAKYGKLRSEQKERAKLELTSAEESQLIEFSARNPSITPLLTHPNANPKKALAAIKEVSDKQVSEKLNPTPTAPTKSTPENLDVVSAATASRPSLGNLDNADVKHSKDKKTESDSKIGKWGMISKKLETAAEHLKTAAEKREKEHTALTIDPNSSKPSVFITPAAAGRSDSFSSASTQVTPDAETSGNSPSKRKGSDKRK